MHDDLAVDDEALVRQRRDGLRDVGERRREIVPGARIERHHAVALLREQAIAVVLELEHPAGARERLARRREHRRQVRGAQTRAPSRRASRSRAASASGRGPIGRADLLDRAPRQHRIVRIVVRALLARVRVALLDQQPLVLAALRLHERPLAAQLVAAQLEQQLALVEPLVDVVQRDPAAAVPDDHRAGAVVAGRDQRLRSSRTRPGGPRRGPRAAYRPGSATAPSARPRTSARRRARAGSRSACAGPRAAGRRTASPDAGARPNGSGV